MLQYEAKLKKYSRLLRSKMTDSEQKLWSRLRNKQISDVPFYRQKPIGQYIVDFYAPKAGLVVEVGGSQYFGGKQIKKDKGGFLRAALLPTRLGEDPFFKALPPHKAAGPACRRAGG